jgi:cytochrome c biogenesis protein CcmG, thiol:disulfide interchange protein DsbE
MKTMTVDSAKPEKQNKGSPVLFILIGLVVVGVIVMMGVWMKKSEVHRLAIGDKMPDFTLTSFDGEPYTLSLLQGKTVVINFWASWCKTCDAESFMLQEVWQDNESAHLVQFLGVDYVDTETPAKEFISSHGMTYPNGPDLGSKISKLFGITGVPETFLIDKNGVLKAIQIGPFDSADDLRDFIKQAESQEEK